MRRNIGHGVNVGVGRSLFRIPKIGKRISIGHIDAKITFWILLLATIVFGGFYLAYYCTEFGCF